MNQTDRYETLREQLNQRKLENRFRNLQPVSEFPSTAYIQIEGKNYLNFSSNDYLGLSNHPLLKKRSSDYTHKFGTSSSSSRLITGTMEIHSSLEEKLAGFYDSGRCLLYSTGFQANSTIFPAITSSDDFILADKRCHNSILTGALASKASFTRFRHNDLDHLESLLVKSRSSHTGMIWIATESIFSMNGDIAPLQELIDLAKKYSASLYVDDAHAIGLYGPNGMGLTEKLGSEIDIIVGTFGKAVGSFGAFVACNHVIADTLINYSNGFIYTTSLPPAVVGAIDAAYELIPKMESERIHLKKLAIKVHQIIIDSGFKTSETATHIVPVIIGDEKLTLNLADMLRKKFIWTVAIRPPTVPDGNSQIRLSLTADHSLENLELLKKELLDA